MKNHKTDKTKTKRQNVKNALNMKEEIKNKVGTEFAN